MIKFVKNETKKSYKKVVFKSPENKYRQGRIKIEDFINNQKKSTELLNENIEPKKPFQTRIRYGNTNFVEENKADAKIWKDLDVAAKEELR